MGLPANQQMHLVALGQMAGREIGADEPGATGDKDALGHRRYRASADEHEARGSGTRSAAPGLEVRLLFADLVEKFHASTIRMSGFSSSIASTERTEIFMPGE